MTGKRTIAIVLPCVAICLAVSSPLWAITRIKDISRVKGQEENTLQGLGLVVGLKGTGDGGKFLPAIRSLATAMQLMGSPIGEGGAGELKDAKNIALVMVTATIPAVGARQGDKIDCVVSSIGGAKSLAGGTLFMTPLQGPEVESTRIYAFAQGPVHLDDATVPTGGRVHRGCRLEEDFLNVFAKDGVVTLVLDKNHADFEMAQAVVMRINETVGGQIVAPSVALRTAGASLQDPGAAAAADDYTARATGPVNIEIRIPPQYADDPVDFISQILALEILQPQTEARVVINERAGSVVINGEVEVGSAVVTHKNIVVETGAAPAADRFVPLSPADDSATTQTKLKALVEALSAVKVPNEDIIDIIKGLERSGKLHARLIIE